MDPSVVSKPTCRSFRRSQLFPATHPITSTCFASCFYWFSGGFEKCCILSEGKLHRELIYWGGFYFGCGGSYFMRDGSRYSVLRFQISSFLSQKIHSTTLCSAFVSVVFWFVLRLKWISSIWWIEGNEKIMRRSRWQSWFSILEGYSLGACTLSRWHFNRALSWLWIIWC